jgi:hypothetical protein
MFTLPQGDSAEDGSSNNRPLDLQGISPNEFRVFAAASIPR